MDLAKEAISTLNDPARTAGNPDQAVKSATDSLIEIIVIASKIDARTGTNDPSSRRRPAKRPSVAEG